MQPNYSNLAPKGELNGLKLLNQLMIEDYALPVESSTKQPSAQRFAVCKVSNFRG